MFLTNKTLLFVFFVYCGLSDFGSVAQRIPSIEKHAEDIAAILQNVDEIYLEDSIPGYLSVYGSSAFPILAGPRTSGGEVGYHPLIAGSRLGKGKIIGCAHDRFLIPEDPGSNYLGRNQFILNSINWVRSNTSGDLPLHVGIFVVNYYPTPLIEFLEEHNITNTVIRQENLDNYFQLTEYDLVICSVAFFDGEKAAPLREYVEHGGGLMVAVTSWAANEEPGHFGMTFPPNQVSSGSVKGGFVWLPDDYSWSDFGVYNASTALLVNTHFNDAWEEIKDQANELGQSTNVLYSIVDYGMQYIPCLA